MFPPPTREREPDLFQIRKFPSRSESIFPFRPDIDEERADLLRITENCVVRELIKTTLVKVRIMNADIELPVSDDHRDISRILITTLSLVESFRVLLATALLCYKEPARRPIGVFCVPKPRVGGFGCDDDHHHLIGLVLGCLLCKAYQLIKSSNVDLCTSSGIMSILDTDLLG